MKNFSSFVVPSKENNFRAFLIKPLSLILISGIIFSFNLTIPVTVGAQGLEVNTTNLLNGHNEIRKDNRLSELTIDNKLNVSAQRKAESMLAADCWSHYCPNGKSPWEFFDEAGYDYLFAGENLAEGFYTIDKLMDAWMNSLTHRENILKKDFTEVGFGIIKGDFQNNPNNLIVVVHFGTEITNVQLASSAALAITSPLSGDIIDQQPLEVLGAASGTNLLNLYLNNNYVSQVGVFNGIFTYKLSNLELGTNRIELVAVDNNTLSDTLDVSYEPATLPSTASRGIPDNLKVVINLTAISFLGVLFLIDFLTLSRTHILGSPNAYSHKTFGLFFIIVIIVIVGGFGTSLLEGISTV